MTERQRARPQTASARISNHVSGGQFHLIHLTILRTCSWPSLAYEVTYNSFIFLLSYHEAPNGQNSNALFFASFHRNQIVTWRFKCFKNSRKQFFTLVPVRFKVLYEDESVSRRRANNFSR